MMDANNRNKDTRNRPSRGCRKGGAIAATLLAMSLCGPAQAADNLRYSWFQIGYARQDVSRDGFQSLPDVNQSVSLEADDGDGIDFRGSLGTWRNFYLFGGFTSTDIDSDAVITNDQGVFPASDEFDLTAIRGGLGYRYEIIFNTDLFFELSYDSLDFDFGSFGGENFDTDDQGPGGSIGIRTLLKDKLELRAFGRYTSVGDADLDKLEINDDTLFGGGFGLTLIRGLSIVGDVEIGEIDTYTLGIRLDFSEE